MWWRELLWQLAGRRTAARRREAEAVNSDGDGLGGIIWVNPMGRPPYAALSVLSRARPSLAVLAFFTMLLPGEPRRPAAVDGQYGRLRVVRPDPENIVQRGSPGYRAEAPIEIVPSPSPVARSWDSQRLWSQHVDWEPAIAADPGSMYIYQLTTRYYAPSCDGCPSPHITFRRSRDGGATWESDSPLSDAPGSQNDPQIEVARDGTVYVAYLQGFTSGVTFQRSSDLGITWSEPVALTGAGPPDWSDKPWLLVSPNGRHVYIGLNASDSYIVASHDRGATFRRPVRTNNDSRYWFHTGGAIAPSGDIYFAAVDYSQDYRGKAHINVIKSSDRGKTWNTYRVDTSSEMPDCSWSKGCYPGFLGPSASLTIDSAGTIMIAYNAGVSMGGAQALWARTSIDGVNWGPRTRLSKASARTNNAFPALAAGTDAGDFHLAWQDDRRAPTRRWNTWYRRTTDNGASWSTPVRLSDRTSGTFYKRKRGYRFPYGDYLEIAVDRAGVVHVIWGEGKSYKGAGGTWFTRGR